MKAPVRYSLFAVGGALLFSVAYFGFSVAFGVPPHELAVVGRFLARPDERSAKPSDARPDAVVAPEPPATAPGPAPAASRASVLSAFAMPAPYSPEELSSLQEELRTALDESRERLERVRTREAELDDWERSLEERLAELRGLQGEIEKSQRELELRSEELARDEALRRARDDESWSEVARFFDEGDPEELAARLLQYGPDEAARILRALEPARVGELVNALPAEKYRAYLEAYRASSKP